MGDSIYGPVVRTARQKFKIGDIVFNISSPHKIGRITGFTMTNKFYVKISIDGSQGVYIHHAADWSKILKAKFKAKNSTDYITKEETVCIPTTKKLSPVSDCSLVLQKTIATGAPKLPVEKEGSTGIAYKPPCAAHILRRALSALRAMIGLS